MAHQSHTDIHACSLDHAKHAAMQILSRQDGACQFMDLTRQSRVPRVSLDDYRAPGSER